MSCRERGWRTGWGVRRWRVAAVAAALYALWLLPPPGTGAAAGARGRGELGAPPLSIAVTPREVDLGDVSFSGHAEKPGAIRVRVEGRSPWRLLMHGLGDLSDGGRPLVTIPLERLSWRLAGSDGDFRPVARAPADVAAAFTVGGSVYAAAPSTYAIDLRLRLNEGDARSPHPFATTLVFTALPAAGASEPDAAVTDGHRGGERDHGAREPKDPEGEDRGGRRPAPPVVPAPPGKGADPGAPGDRNPGPGGARGDQGGGGALPGAAEAPRR